MTFPKSVEMPVKVSQSLLAERCMFFATIILSASEVLSTVTTVNPRGKRKGWSYAIL